MRNVIAIVGAVLLAACSGGSTATPEERIDEFNQRLDAADYDAIWQSTAAEFKEVVTRDEFALMLESAHEALGDFESAQTISTEETEIDGMQFVEVHQLVTYENDEADVSFRFKRDDLSLASWDIDSNLVLDEYLRRQRLAEEGAAATE